MKNWIKHLLFLPGIIVIVMIGACSKKSVSENLVNQVQAARVDFRDSIVGIYVGVLHHTYYSNQYPFGNDTVVGTDSLFVRKAITDTNGIVINGIDSFSNIYVQDTVEIGYSGGTANVGNVDNEASFARQNGLRSLTYIYDDDGSGLHPEHYLCQANKVK
jgi:hypothetical protein